MVRQTIQFSSITQVDIPKIVGPQHSSPAEKEAVEDIHRDLEKEARIRAGKISDLAMIPMVVGKASGITVPWRMPAHILRTDN